MGCVFGREVSGRPVGREERKKDEVGRVSKRAEKGGEEVRDGSNIQRVEEENAEEEEAAAAAAAGDKARAKRSSGPNPRLSSPPRHVHGEQVATGWPSWLSNVAGEAVSGWTPRRADSFEKIDKVKCYMHQLLSGLEHCHIRHALHRDIKGSNLLIDNSGVLKIGDFGLASFFDPNHKQPMTSRVVTLWYRPPELLLGATDYGIGVDLWSAGCILSELLTGRPIMPGRTKVEQLHKIFKLCGSPSDEYWKKSKLPHATIFKPQQSYKRCIAETFKDFPTSSLLLIDTLLAIYPVERLTATAALNSEFFMTKPYACDPSSLPKYPPCKEMDAKLRGEEARRLRAAGRANADGVKKTCSRDRAVCAIPAPEANAELQANLDRRRMITYANAKSKSEKFPPPHQDGTLGYPLGSAHPIDPDFDPPDVPFNMSFSFSNKAPIQTWSGPLMDSSGVSAPRRKKHMPGDGYSHSKSSKRDKNSSRI